MNRRKFLRVAAVALGAGALTCSGLAALMTGEYQPDDPLPLGYPEIRSGVTQMTKKILVVYASAAGSTGGVAETIGSSLTERGAEVDVLPVQSVAALDEYQAVVLGSAIHGGKWLPEAVEFLQANQGRLNQIPTAFFLVGLMVASKSESNRNMVAQFLEEQRTLVKPVSEGRFVGAMFPNKYPFFTGFGMRFFIAYCGLGLRGGDFRNPDTIRTWAGSVYPLLIH